MKEKDQQQHGAVRRHSDNDVPQRSAAAVQPATDETGRLPYEAPTVQVIEVQTERGYAGSAFNSPWTPGEW